MLAAKFHGLSCRFPFSTPIILPGVNDGTCLEKYKLPVYQDVYPYGFYAANYKKCMVVQGLPIKSANARGKLHAILDSNNQRTSMITLSVTIIGQFL